MNWLSEHMRGESQQHSQQQQQQQQRRRPTQQRQQQQRSRRQAPRQQERGRPPPRSKQQHAQQPRPNQTLTDRQKLALLRQQGSVTYDARTGMIASQHTEHRHPLGTVVHMVGTPRTEHHHVVRMSMIIMVRGDTGNGLRVIHADGGFRPSHRTFLFAAPPSPIWAHVCSRPP